MVGYESLANHYKTNFALMQHHKYSLSELEGMVPWERQLYVGLLKEYIEEEEKKAKDREAAAKASRKANR
jgi:hypothetical protein